MRVVVLGGGPGGLYLALLLRGRHPDWQVRVLERNSADSTFGWGVVFSDETLGHFEAADAISYQAITESFRRWSDIDVIVERERVRSTGHGFCGLGRKQLLQVLQARCRELGVELCFETSFEGPDEFLDADLVVAADGINSNCRESRAEIFRPSLTPGQARFIWLGTDHVLDTFTFVFRESEHGLFQVHAYPFSEDCSTFIVETSEETLRRSGLQDAPIEESLRYLGELFAPELQGHALRSNRSSWIAFREVKNQTWHHENLVLLGDAAHTAHFSIGSGTKLAMEDAIALADALEQERNIPAALAQYQQARWVDVAKLQKTAVTSQQWFEHAEVMFRRLEPLQLVTSLLTRSKRVTHENLRARDPALVERVDRRFADQAGVAPRGPGAAPPPPMFTPFRLREMELSNRVVVSPMCQYRADDGLVDDWHMVHLGSRAVGGAGLVIAEMTAVSRDARITRGCAGLYRDSHVAAWRRIVDFVHRESGARIALQLGHAGRKGSTELPWEAPSDSHLREGGWETIAPSAVPFAEGGQLPREMTRQDMEAVCDDFVAAARRALEAGFDMLELHMAHGYLLASFLSPLCNRRQDRYGGSLENRARFPLEVLDAVRAVWPDARPISVRISATDWAEGGWTLAESVAFARLLEDHGCDLVDVSSGQTSEESSPVYGRMFQTPFSNLIRNEVGIATMAVGAILGWDHVNTIVASGRADLCALARPHLRDPYLTLSAASEQGHEGLAWPAPYLPARPPPSGA